MCFYLKRCHYSMMKPTEPKGCISNPITGRLLIVICPPLPFKLLKNCVILPEKFGRMESMPKGTSTIDVKLFKFVARIMKLEPNDQTPTSTRSIAVPVNEASWLKMYCVIIGSAWARFVAACFMSAGVGSFQGTIPVAN